MDPLSMTASIVALGTALQATASGIQKLLALKGAPRRLLEVHNQVEELKVLLEVTRDGAQSSTITDPTVILRFNRLVDRATEVAREASIFVREKLVKNSASLDDECAKIEIRKISFLRRENKLNNLVAQLSQVQGSLHSALECINSVKIHQMTVTLDSFAASAVKAEIIEFLVKQGAETDVEDRHHFTPHDVIWELYLRNPEKRAHFLTAGGLSPGDTTSLEKQFFSPVHQIVLGIGPSLDLDAYLNMDGREIDAQDYSGKTPLSWAAQRKNTRMVRILLRHMASVSIPDYRGKTPLHLASGSGTLEAVGLILEVIKDMEKDLDDPKKSLIHAQDEKNGTPLNYATRGDLY